MMAIRRLPEYVINKLKAGEIVERPVSIMKELVENSLDAGAEEVSIAIVDGGKTRIAVQDDGSGITIDDMEMVLERFATSKIMSEEDIFSLQSFGFRGEALASIGEVSRMTVTSKTVAQITGMQLVKRGESITIKKTPTAFQHGTIVSVEDIFYNVPARQKFLKSSQTEYYYCYNYFTDIALSLPNKHLTLQKNQKTIFDLPPTEALIDRITQIYKKDWSDQLRLVEQDIEGLHITGVIGDAQLHFGSPAHIKIYVNNRPVQDKIIKKAIMEGYRRQIVPGEYPFALLFVTIDPARVDVNVHPRKLEVKFLDSQTVYQAVYSMIKSSLSDNKIMSQELGSSVERRGVETYNKYSSSVPQGLSGYSSAGGQSSHNNPHPLITPDSPTVSSRQSFDTIRDNQTTFHQDFQLIGQLRNVYIVLQGADALYYIDQHALAERIAFEKLKKNLDPSQQDTLLQPLTMTVSNIGALEEKIDTLNDLGFDITLLGDNKIAIYAVPKVFVTYRVDLEKLFAHVLYLDSITYDHILDEIFAMRACKMSIKAGERLSRQQMEQLVKDGFTHIDGMFVCQHGRPFFIKIDKKQIDKLMDR